MKSKEYAKRVASKWGCTITPPLHEEKVWIPKNELNFPSLASEIKLSEKEWEQIGFPFHPIPENVETHVDVGEWKKERFSLKNSNKTGFIIMTDVLRDLETGVDSEVRPPGNMATISKNFFPQPSIDLPRIADALATEVKKGNMAGPLPKGFVKNAKINSLMSIKKPDGSRRQVGNLSSPVGSSFNDGISAETLRKWKVYQTTSKQFSQMVARAGRGAVLACCDMNSAYKCLPVCIDQRRLQCFHFLEREFVDLRMIFGDQSACMYFDRLHWCIIEFFVLSRSQIPRRWIGRTVDDIPAVAPKIASEILNSFTETYKCQLSRLNIGFAPVDNERKKAFDASTSGEVLGVWYDTEDMSWKLSDRKLVLLIDELMEAVSPNEKISVNQVEVIHGKLNHFAQLCPPIKLLIGEVLFFLKKSLAKLPDMRSQLRYKKDLIVPSSMKVELSTCAAIVWDTLCHPLPVLEQDAPLALEAVQVFTDFSGHLLANPSLGVYIPSEFKEGPIVMSLAFPRKFLLSEDGEGHKCYSKSTSLEALGFLVPLVMKPDKFIGRKTIVISDNAASVLILGKGYSSGDPWATTICRAARVVAAALGCDLLAKWEPRRSSRETRISDNLTHNLLDELEREEVTAYIEDRSVSFPHPVLQWMAQPGIDTDLGYKCLRWMSSKFDKVRALRS